MLIPVTLTMNTEIDTKDDEVSATLTREQELDEALLDLGIEKTELLDAQEIDVTVSKDKLFDCQNIAKEYKMTLEGKTRVEGKKENNYKFVQKGKAIASEKYINLTYSLLNSFSDTSNISSNKKFEEFFVQLKDAFNKARDMGIRDKGIRDGTFSPILTLFKQKLVNIGQIITNESGNMKLLLEKLKRAEEEGDFDFGKKAEI